MKLWTSFVVCAQMASLESSGRPRRVVRRASEEDAPPPAPTPELLERVREYLEVRERGDGTNEIRRKRESAMSNPIWQVGNYFLSLESLLPAIPEDAETRDPLDYKELARFGYQDLVGDIVAAGGRRQVADALGIELSRPRKPPVVVRGVSLTKDEDAGKISLGAAKEAKVEALAETTKAKDLLLSDEERTAKDYRRRNAKSKTTTAKSRLVTVVPTKKKKDNVEDDELLPREWPLPLAPFGLSAAGRAYAGVFFFALAAQPEARATRELLAALGDGAFARTIIDGVHDLSFALLAANVAAAALGAFQVLTSSSSSREEREGNPEEEPLPVAAARSVLCALVGGPLALLVSK
mmetsp:Transcript_22137/g.71364  ORF Transcript_22137/g.71364 Transcript_22137/m.71364 type:complete len:352 (+) Transcript_22137:25-1080(+)